MQVLRGASNLFKYWYKNYQVAVIISVVMPFVIGFYGYSYIKAFFSALMFIFLFWGLFATNKISKHYKISANQKCANAQYNLAMNYQGLKNSDSEVSTPTEK